MQASSSVGNTEDNGENGETDPGAGVPVSAYGAGGGETEGAACGPRAMRVRLC
jgi:hypothetical protein